MNPIQERGTYKCDGKPLECFSQRNDMNLIYIFKRPLGKMYGRGKTRWEIIVVVHEGMIAQTRVDIPIVLEVKSCRHVNRLYLRGEK